MQDKQTIIKNYRQLAQVCYELLYGADCADVVSGDREILREAFFNNLFKTLQTAFGLTISADKLTKFARTYGTKPSEEALADFLVESLENLETYIVLNYYYLQFVIALAKYAKEDQREKIEQLIVEKGLKNSDLEAIETSYKRLLTPQQKVAVAVRAPLLP